MSKSTNLSFLTNFVTADIVNSRVGINNVSPQTTLDVTGTGKFSGVLTLGSTISNGTYAYTLPSATGTFALTSDIPSLVGYVPYTGATSNVNLGTNSISAGAVTSTGGLRVETSGGTGYALNLRQATGFSLWSGAPYTSIYANTSNQVIVRFSNDNRSITLDGSIVSASTPRTFTFPDATGTIALTSQIPTNPVGGTGTNGHVARFSGSSTIENSYITDTENTATAIVKNSSSVTAPIFKVVPISISNASIINLDNGGAGTFYVGRQNASGNSDLIGSLGAYASVIGHTGSQDFNIITNSLVRVLVNGSTGEATFSSTLQTTNIGINNAPTLARLFANQTTDGEWIATFKNYGGSASYGVSIDMSGSTSNQAAFQVYTSTGTGLKLANNGRLLLGTFTDSGYKLDVNGTGRFSGSININNSAASNYDLNIYNTIPRIHLQNPSSGTSTTDGFHIYQSGLDSYIINKEASDLYLGSNNSINLTIASTGAATFNLGSGEMRLNRTGTSEYLKLNTYYLLTDGNDQLLGSVTGATSVYAGNGVLPRLTISTTGTATFSSSVETVARFSSSGDSTIIIGGNAAQGISSGEQYITYQNGTTNSNAWMVGMDDGEDWRFAYGQVGEITDANSLIRITQGGNVLIGTTTDSGGKLRVEGGELRVTTSNSGVALYENLGVGEIAAYNWGGGAYIPLVHVGSEHRFNTSTSERMRITSGGFFKASNNGNYIATESFHELRTNQDARAALITNSSTTLTKENGLDIIFTAASPNNATSKFIVCEDTSAFRFIVYSNGNVANTNNSYGSISDIKLKENIIDASPKLNDLLKVKVRNYNLIGEEAKQIGVIAQELEEIFPAMVDESIDKDKDGNDLGTTTKSVKYSVFVPMLIKAIQEQQVQIQELKNKLS